MQVQVLVRSNARLLMLALAALAAPASAGAQEAPGAWDAPYRALTFDGECVEIPIELARTQVLVDGVFVNGEGPFRFLLDTGAQGSGRIDTSLAKRLGLEPAGKVRGSDGTGRAGPEMDVFVLDSLTLGGLRAEGARVLSRDYNLHGAAARGPIDGILGIGLFAEVLLTIDYPARVLRLETGALPEPDGREVLPLARDSAIPTVMLELGGEEHLAHLDSGSMGPLSLPASLESSLELTGAPQVVGQARTVSGPFEIRAAHVEGELVLGRHVTFRPRVVFAGPLRRLNIGGEVLADYAMTLDQREGRVRFWRAGFPAHEAAPERTRLRQPELRVPMPSVKRRPFIEATIDGAGPYRFILDTGAGTCVLDGELARELELEVTGETTLGVPGGEQRVPAKTHVVPVISVGAAEFHEVPVMSWDLPEIMDQLGGVRGIIGLPLFHDLLTTMDLSAQELVLSHDTLQGLGIESVGYVLDGDGLPEFEIDVAGHSITAHLDTGNPSMLVIPASAAAALPLGHEPRVVGRGRTASGVFEIRGAPLKGTVDVLGMRLENPSLRFQDWNEYANIGGGLVAGKALTFDQRARRLAVSGGIPAAGSDERKASKDRGTYGFMLALTNRGPIAINGIVPGSVAEKAGLQTGDQIVALNGVPIDQLDMEQRSAALRAPELKLTIERGGERVEFELVR